jgi:hypothetical protein
MRRPLPSGRCRGTTTRWLALSATAAILAATSTVAAVPERAAAAPSSSSSIASFAPHNVGAPQVAVTPDGSQQIVFWKDATTNQLAEAWYALGSWHGPVGFPQLGALTATPAVAVAKDGSQQLVFWEGPGGHLFEAWYALAAWHGPVDITNGSLGGHAILGSAPSVVTTTDGSQLVFWRGTDGHLGEAWYSAGGWHGPSDFTTLGKLASAPSATITPDGSQQLVFFQGTNNLLTEDWYALGSWHGPMAFGAISSPPSITVTPDGSTQLVFSRTAAGHLQESWYTGSWHGPVDWTTSAFAGNGLLTSSPSATVTVDGSTQIVFWQGAGSTLWEGWYAGGAWHGPVDFSTGIAQPTTGVISGTVSDSLTHAAIAGATVSYSGGSATATTNAGGLYTLPGVTAGRMYTVSAVASGYAFSTATVTVGAGTIATQSFALVTPSPDPLSQPFTNTSIWNTPIGSGATWMPANLVPATTKTLVSDQHIIVMTQTAPSTALNDSTAGWTGGDRCVATGPFSPPGTAPIPDSFVIPSSTMNDPLVAVAADGHTLIQGEPFARCTPGGPATLEFLDSRSGADLLGDGLQGFDGGSGMSALGGAIRLGELIPDGVISHALQIDVDAWANLYPGTAPTCFVWPATKCDTYGPTVYGGTNSYLKMGALLALPPSVPIDSLGLETPAGRILATAFKNFGAYVSNDASSATRERSVNNIVTELGPSGSVAATPTDPGQFQTMWSFPFETTGVNGTDGWSHDIAAIFAALAIVTNNSPTSIGGGGSPL